MKFYNFEDKVVTIPVDLGAARRSFFQKEKLDRQAVGPSEISKDEGRKKQPKVEVGVNMINLNARNPEKEEGNQAKKVRKEKEGPGLDAEDPLDHLAEAFAKAVRLRPCSPRKDGNKFITNAERYTGLTPRKAANITMISSNMTNEHSKINLGNWIMFRKRWSQKKGKTRTEFRAEECFRKMEGGRRLSKNSNLRNNDRKHVFDNYQAPGYEVEKKDQTRKEEHRQRRVSEGQLTWKEYPGGKLSATDYLRGTGPPKTPRVMIL